MMRRLAAPLTLFFLTPLIAEYLLGSLPMSMIALLPLMAAMYGSAAILIRELVRRSGRGWPSIVLFATAYGFLEEGMVTQSLFNPNYLHLHLLKFGWLPELGTALPWLVFVIITHVAWSICVPIGFTEALFPSRQREPWLTRVGMIVFPLLLVAGSALVAVFSYRQVPFIASPLQFAVVGAVIIALTAAALLWPRSAQVPAGSVPHAAALCAASFIAGSALQLLKHYGPIWHLGWPAAVAAVLGIAAAFVIFMVIFTRGRAWNDTQRWALMAGALLVYVWSGFGADISLHGTGGIGAHALLAVAIVLLAGLAGVRSAQT